MQTSSRKALWKAMPRGLAVSIDNVSNSREPNAGSCLVSARLSTGDRDNDRLLTFGEFAHMTMFLNPEE